MPQHQERSTTSGGCGQSGERHRKTIPYVLFTYAGPRCARGYPDGVDANDSGVIVGQVVDVMTRVRKQESSRRTGADWCIRQPGMRRALELTERGTMFSREEERAAGRLATHHAATVST